MPIPPAATTQNEPAPRTCPGCSGVFTPEHDERVYCSPACRKRAKNRRVRERNVVARPTTTPCLDCAAEIPLAPVGAPLRRCGACRAHRASERALRRRREEYAARAALNPSEPPSWRSRLLDRLTNRKA